MGDTKNILVGKRRREKRKKERKKGKRDNSKHSK